VSDERERALKEGKRERKYFGGKSASCTPVGKKGEGVREEFFSPEEAPKKKKKKKAQPPQEEAELESPIVNSKSHPKSKPFKGFEPHLIRW